MTMLLLLLTIALVTHTMIVQSSNVARHIREAELDLCDTSSYATKQKVNCFCKYTVVLSKTFVFKAECYIEENNIPENDDIWKLFSSIKTIERLTLSSKSESNHLTYIPTEALQTLKDLFKLNIQKGKIENLHAYAFANLTKLEELKLSDNRIKKLAVNSFSHHPNLMSITLDKNKIEEIERNVFRRMPKLQELLLTLNRISFIHDRAFSHLENLKLLELDHNAIFVLTNETFWGLESLTRLELSHNHLEVIGDNTFLPLKSLEALNLANNQIKVLDSKAFNGLTNLQSLSLGNNKIKELSDPIIFTTVPSLVVLDVKNNNITLFTNETISPIIRNFYNIGSSLSVEENKFPCDCNISWLLNLKNNTKNTRLQESLDNLMCYPNPQLAGEYEKLEKSEKSTTDFSRDNENQDYDYYDSINLNGKLFFSDIPAKILPCDNKKTTAIMSELESTMPTTAKSIPTTTEKVTDQTIPSTTTQSYSRTDVTTTPILTSTGFTPTSPASNTILFSEYTPESTTTQRILSTMKPKLQTTEFYHYTTEPVTTRRDQNPVRSFEATEEMVSDGESSASYSMETKNEEVVNEIVSTSVPKSFYSDENSRNVIMEETFATSTAIRDQKSPESLSHVHYSPKNNASSNHSVILVNLICLFFVLEKIL